MLVHIIDGSSPDPVGDFNAIQTELELFAEDLASKPQASTDMHHMMHEHGGINPSCKHAPRHGLCRCTRHGGVLSS